MLHLKPTVLVDSEPEGCRFRLAFDASAQQLHPLFAEGASRSFLVRWSDTGDLDEFRFAGVIRGTAVFERHRWTPGEPGKPWPPEARLLWSEEGPR